MNQLEFDVKITNGDLYDYMLRHTYHLATEKTEIFNDILPVHRAC